MSVNPARKRPYVGLVAAAVTILALAFAPGATATAWAGMLRGMSVSVVIDAPHDTEYQIDLVATESVATATGDEQRLYVDIRRCVRTHCSVIEHAQRPLASSDISVDPAMTSASLTTLISGLKLHVNATWSPVDRASEGISTPGFGVYPLETVAGGPNPRVESDVNATGTVSIGRLMCGSKTVDVYTYSGVDRVGDDVRDPRKSGVSWPRALLTALGHSQCH